MPTIEPGCISQPAVSAALLQRARKAESEAGQRLGRIFHVKPDVSQDSLPVLQIDDLG